jgi:hypothetical protein
MKKEITVSVTEYDILNGERANAYGCPLQIALRKIFPFRKIFVDYAYVNMSPPKPFTWAICMRAYKLSEEARQFVVDFDNRRPVKPCTFTLKKIGG